MQPENKNFQRQQLVQLEKTLYLKHKFSLIVAIFNHYPYRDKLIRKISQIFNDSTKLEISRDSCPDFETFEEQLACFSKTYGLIQIVNNGERLYKETIPLFYKGLNYHREALAKENPVSIILWMLPEDVEDFAYNAPDMWSWHGGIFDFEISGEHHEDTASFPFIRLTTQEREKKRKRIEDILEYLQANPELEDPVKASLQQELAQLYYALSDYIHAETYTVKTLELHRKRGNVEEMYRLYHFLEVIYRDMGENEKLIKAILERILLNKSSEIDKYSLNRGEYGMGEEKKKPDMILVVDDEPDMKELIEQKFIDRIRRKEWEFVYAANGIEALEQLRVFPDIGVVLLDIRMPGMDGLTFLDRLNAMDKPVIKTIMVTAYGDMENIRKSMNKGAFDFITKKVDFNDLEKTIEKAIKESNIIKDALETKKKLMEYEKELEIAAQVQKSILPHRFPSYLFADMRAAKEVGGDFYDYSVTDENEVAFFIGDVEGKGLSAALLAVNCAKILKALAEQGKLPGECLQILNDRLIEEREEDQISVSLFYGLLDLRSGVIKYCRAGYIALPLIIHKNGTVTQLKEVTGFPLGFFGGVSYECQEDKLNKDEIIFIFTDGINDAENMQKERFEDGEPRIISTLKKTVGMSVKKSVETFMTDIAAFVGGAPQNDDITIMALKLA